MDDLWGIKGSLELFNAWRAVDRPVEIHLYQSGDGGFWNKDGRGEHVINRLEDWMRVNGWLERKR